MAPIPLTSPRAGDATSTAPALAVAGLSKRFAAISVLRDVDLAVAEGSILALLGPSGCGKTTLLRLVAGFERADAGSVMLRGRLVADGGAGGGRWVPPFRRSIGYVPQDGMLFPHLDVARNIGFGLSATQRRAGIVDAMLDLVGLAGLGRRMPHELSGGQQRRVAIARALAPAPALMLLDEPFSALDAPLRRALCAEVRSLLRARASSAVMVTHDRDEAFSVADRVAVMRSGRIVQCAPPAELYRTPVDLETACLVGAALSVPGVLTGAAADTPLGRLPVRDPHGVGDGRAVFMIRPEQLVASEQGGGVRVVVRDATMLGPATWLDVETADGAIPLRASWAATDLPALRQSLVVRVLGDVLALPSARS